MYSNSGDELIAGALEALWLMVDDSDRSGLSFGRLQLIRQFPIVECLRGCQQLMQLNGHHLLSEIVQRHAPKNANVARAVFRLMSELWQMMVRHGMDPMDHVMQLEGFDRCEDVHSFG